MEMLLAIVIAAVPYIAVCALFGWSDHCQRVRRDVRDRQIALMEEIHAQLGAVAAPVLRRRRDRWQVRVAVPVDRPTVTAILLTIVREAFAARDGERRSLEVIVTRQAESATKRTAAGSIQWESLPCT